MAVCYLCIGSNLGNRRQNIRLAIGKIDQLEATKVIKISRLHETEPVGGPKAQGKFLNAALKIKTEFSPSRLLKKLKAIERQLGRNGRYLHYGPRTIDLDMLFYADKFINRENLKIPHPKVFEREFVMRPLLEIL